MMYWMDEKLVHLEIMVNSEWISNYKLVVGRILAKNQLKSLGKDEAAVKGGIRWYKWKFFGVSKSRLDISTMGED